MEPSSRPESWAPFRTWMKAYQPPRWDLTASGIAPCTLADLPGAIEAVELFDENADGYPPLTRALSRRLGVEPTRIVTAHGATGAAALALAALIRPGDRVVVEWPSYDPLAGVVRLLGGELVDLTREWSEGFALDPDELAQKLTHDVKAIVLTNPHDPSGVHEDPRRLREVGVLADAVGAKVVVDEVCLDLLAGVDTSPAATLGDAFVSVNGFGKAYGLTGLALGWMVSDPVTAEKARRVRDLLEGPGAVPVERIGVMAAAQMERLAARGRDALEPSFALLAAFVEGRRELEWVRPAGGPLAFPRLTAVDDAGEFVRVAREEFGVGVVPGALFGYRQNFRIAVGRGRAVVEGGLDALGRALDLGTY